MPTVIVDGQEIEIGPEERLNGIQVAERAGVEIPHYCWHPGLSVVASCRMCLVESGRRDPASGEISMVPKLVPACQTPATDGTVFVTNSEKVEQARALVEEDLLIRHPIDCPICDKAGECHLQDYHFKHGREERRADLKPFTSRRRELGDTVTLFVDRCVMCSRCVRFTREVTGSAELMVVNRGAHEEIDVFPGFPLDNPMSGNVVDLCPVGALGDRDFLYKQRVWFMKQHDHVCGGCSTGCSIQIEENQDQVYRLKPRENPAVNQWWMCDEGRYGWKHIHDEHRLTQPVQGRGEARTHADWSTLVTELDRHLRAANKPLAVLSPHLTIEEAFLIRRYFEGLPGEAHFAMTPVPIEGEDQKFGEFTISAEKCPNRYGVAEILRGEGGQFQTWEELLDSAALAETDAAWVFGGYKKDWNDSEAQSFSTIKTLIVQDLFDSPLYQLADYGLPAVSFAEREGSYVNRHGWLQSFQWAIRPPAGVRSAGQLFWLLLQRVGLYQPGAIRVELAAAYEPFAAATEVGSQGVDLKAGSPSLT